jgi:outer membrane receptor protein involved in Fe transport
MNCNQPLQAALIALYFFLWGNELQAQSQLDKITGTLINQLTKKPIPFASIVLLNNQDSSIVVGSKSDTHGKFTLNTNTTNTFLKISSIGYKDKFIQTIKVVNGKLSLGTIPIERKNSKLKAVVVQSEKSTTEFKLDKRIFNVGQDLSSSGASALEVLNNVPSVNVNIEGEIALRGTTGVQILINGKPSVIASESGNTLGTITADMIEKIEVITNPSAKYEAEGSAGIINIVLKKEKRKGVNGSASLNLGWPQNHSFGLSLNRRSEKFNLFSQLGAGYRELPRFNKSINTDLVNNTSINSEGEEFRNEQFYNFILGTDYYINKRNVLTLSGSIALEVEEQPSSYNFNSTDANGNILSEWNRSETTEALNPKYQYELQYKRDFKDHKDHSLLFSAIGNFFGKDQSSEFENRTIAGLSNDGNQRTRTNFKEEKYTFNLDYTKPFKKFFTLESGAQYQIQDVSNDYEVSDYINQDWVIDPGLTNVFNYAQNVLGIYSTIAYEKDKWGVKLGMRAENTDLNTVLENTGETNDRNFTNFFPSFHTSYKINQAFSVQAGYSRRIYRPRLWDLNPFFNIRNNFSIRAGNPDLLPEFTNSFEIAGIYIFKKAMLNLNLYQRNTSEVIERISFFEDNVNTVRPTNIGTNSATGIELLSEIEPHKKIKILSEIDYNYFNRIGSLETQVFDFSADRWSAEVTTKFKLPKELDIEISGEYRSGYQTIQGNTRHQAFANMGVRKKLFKKRGVLNFSMRDIFASRIRQTETNQTNFYVFSRDYRGRFMTLGFSYSFGKGEAMEFSGRRRR